MSDDCDCEFGHLGYHRMLLKDGETILHPTPDQLEDAQSLDDLPPALLTLIDRKDGVEMVWRDEDVALDKDET